MREGPELLDFSVDELAEQLTLLDVVSTGAGRGCGADSVEHRSYTPTHTHTLPPSPPPLRSCLHACVPASAWARCGPSGTVQGPRAPPPRYAPL